MVILMSQFVSTQITKKIHQEFEITKTDRISRINKKAIKAAKNRNYKELVFNKIITADSKTLDSILIQEWDDDFNIWRYSGKQEFTYDGDKIETTITFTWNGVSSTLDPFIKDEYTFDSNGNLSSQMRSFQNTPNIWEFVSKTEYTYDSSDNLILEENFSWILNQWANTYKNEITYNTNQQVTLDKGYEWDIVLNQWVNLYMGEYFYTDGLMTSEINSLWNQGNDQWYFHSKWEYSRGAFHPWVPDFEILYRRDINNIAWVYETKIENEWIHWGSPLFLLTKQTYFTWDISMNQWEYDYKDDYQYDSNGNRTIGTYYEWIETPGEWAPYYKDEFIFDLAYNFSDLITPINDDDELDDTVYWFNNMVIGYRGYEFTNQVWEDVSKTLFYYSNYTNPLYVNDYELLANSIQVYPNPIANILVVDSKIPLNKVEIYSILGNMVKEFNSNFNALPVYDISAGLYIVKIQSENHTVSKKIIKQ